MTKNTTRPCQAHNPATCPYHRNGVMAQLHKDAANTAIAEGKTDTALYHLDEAEAYAKRQTTIDNGDYASVAEFTRKDIALDKANANSKHTPVLKAAPREGLGYGKKELDRISVYMTSKQWLDLQDLATHRGVKIDYESVEDQGGQVRVSRFLAKGEHNDIMRIDAQIRENADLNRPALLNAIKAKPVDRAPVGFVSNMSSSDLARIQTLAAELDVKMNGGHYDQQPNGSINVSGLTLTGTDHSVAVIQNHLERYKQSTPFIGRGGPGKGGRDFMPAEFDTPTEHVATIPTFEEFKQMFGFGKKRR